MVKNTLFVFLVSIVSISNMFGSASSTNSTFKVTFAAKGNGLKPLGENNPVNTANRTVPNDELVTRVASRPNIVPAVCIGRNVPNKNLSSASSSAEGKKVTNNL